jgi:hypothetical protein
MVVVLADNLTSSLMQYAQAIAETINISGSKRAATVVLTALPKM